MRLPGLDPERTYRVNGMTLTGRALAKAGLQMPLMAPEQAVLIEASRGS